MQITKTNTEWNDSFCFHRNSGSSNILAEGIYLILALRKLVLASVLKELLPKRRVLIK